MKRALVAIAVLLMTACGSDNGSPTQPATSLTGTWSGIVSAFGSPAGPGGIQATIAESGNALTGTWGTSYPNPIFNSSGSLTGAVNGTAVSLTLSSSVAGGCPYSATATLSSSTLMAGTFATVSCSVAQSGTFNLGKQ